MLFKMNKVSPKIYKINSPSFIELYGTKYYGVFHSKFNNNGTDIYTLIISEMWEKI